MAAGTTSNAVVNHDELDVCDSLIENGGLVSAFLDLVLPDHGTPLYHQVPAELQQFIIKAQLDCGTYAEQTSH
jgi:hypothetical protein